MPFPLIPFAIAGLVALAAGKQLSKSDKGVMTTERRVILESALAQEKNPDKLDKLADAFAAEGLTAEADLLRQRATLRRLPEDVKDAHREAYRAGMTSQDPAAVTNLAKAFAATGADGAANSLKTYAKALSTGQLVTKVKVAAPPPAPPKAPVRPAHNWHNVATAPTDPAQQALNAAANLVQQTAEQAAQAVAASAANQAADAVTDATGIKLPHL